MDDIKTVQDNAVLSRLAMQVTLILDVERILPDCIRRRFGIYLTCCIKPVGPQFTLVSLINMLEEIFENGCTYNESFKE